MGNDLKIDCEKLDDSFLIQYTSGKNIKVKEFTCGASYSTMAGSEKSQIPLYSDVDIDISVPDYLEIGEFDNISTYKDLRIGKVLIKPKKPGKIRAFAKHLKIKVFIEVLTSS